MVRRDHLRHFAVSCALAVAGALVVGRWGGIAFAFLIGAAKELWDWKAGRGTAEWSDMVANGAGLLLAWGVLALFGV